MKKVNFYDENTRQWWVPITGGSNVPALNDLLGQWGVALGDTVLEGQFELPPQGTVDFASGTSLVKFPKGGKVVIPLSEGSGS